MNEAKKSLEGEIQVEIQNLSIMEDGSPEKERAVSHLAQLYKIRNEETKIKNDFLASIGKVVTDGCVALFGTLLSLKAYDKWFDKGLKFEKDGIVTSTVFKGLMNFLKPKR